MQTFNDAEIARELEERPDQAVAELEKTIAGEETKQTKFQQRFEAATRRSTDLEKERDGILLAAADGDKRAEKRAEDLRAAEVKASDEAKDLAKVVAGAEDRLATLRRQLSDLRVRVLFRRQDENRAEQLKIDVEIDAVLDKFLALLKRRNDIGLRTYNLARILGNNNSRFLPEVGAAHVIGAPTAELLRHQAFAFERQHFARTFADFDRDLFKRLMPAEETEGGDAEVA